MPIGDVGSQVAASPYSTGGGGTVFEHRYAATVLGCLLTGDPVPGLGDDAGPIMVRFQASAVSPVDDVLVEGRVPDGEIRRLSVGVRRAPAFVASEVPSEHLFASSLRVVTEHWEEVVAGRWRLALVVASPNAAVRQLRALCAIAQATDNEPAFRAKVAEPGEASQAVRARLRHIDTLVQAAAARANIDSTVIAPNVLTWRLLSALRPLEVRLEGPDQSDRTIAVRQLRPATREGTPAAADQLFTRLAELTGQYAPAGAEVTEGLLRRDLAGISLARSPSFPQSWSLLDRLAERLRDRTRFNLTDDQKVLEIPRTEARSALATAMQAAAVGPAILIVRGEPDVGKSALALRAAEDMAAAGAAVTSVSLQDLPADMLTLETVLGGQLVEVLSATATASTRLLVLDGVESVLEGRSTLLTELTIAALRAGLGVIAVTREDAAAAVADAMRSAQAAAGSAVLREHHVPRLLPGEAEQIAAVFPVLSRIGQDLRAAWLLGRPGLVELLLRAHVAWRLPDGPLSESDLFAAIWDQLVRRGGEHPPGGPSPEARERALTSLARTLLLPGGNHTLPDPTVLPSLRSDGLLLAPGPTSAWHSGDAFASDVVRDLALTRLLIIDGWQLLLDAGAPRFALRAARAACQAALSAAGEDTEPPRARLQAVFDQLANQHGARWAEVPLEAMLTHGDAEAVLRRAWPSLLAEQRSGLRTLLRLALHRYSDHEWGDPAALGPLVALTYCGDAEVGQHDRYDRDTGEQVRKVVLAWLRGLIKIKAGTLSLRQRVRDRLLASSPEDHDEFAVEVLAMLGPDLDHNAEAFLRKQADEGGGYLAPAVESVGAVIALSQYQPQLLLTLAEAYYIEPHDAEHMGSWGLLDEGIRHHARAGGGGPPFAGWYFGPFYRLLHTRPVDALAMVNRMLDRAAIVRVGPNPDQPTGVDAPELPPLGLELDLPGVGVRHCVGDEHVWAWYRGSSVGPYPCVSALLAVERFADELVDTLGVPLARVAEILLRDCHNLAMPALVVGLLVRHLDRAGDMLDRWLVRPELWHLETSRAVGEHFHAQGPDPTDLVGRHRRTASFQNVVGEMIVMAMLAGDHDRLSFLAARGDELVERARELVAGSDDEAADLLMVQGWAAQFRAENYRLSRTEDGHIRFEWAVPEDIAAGLTHTHEEFARGDMALRLHQTYTRSEDRVAPVDTLVDDLLLARDLAEHPAVRGPAHPADPVAAVAAASVIAHAQGRARLPDEDLRWAANVLIDVATSPRVGELSRSVTIDPDGADRSAAVALPALLLPAFDHILLNRQGIEEALLASATSLFDEVRAVFALGVGPIWSAPCTPNPPAETCRHQLAWAAVEQGLRDCRLGGWDQATQQRLTDPLDPPYETTLPAVPTELLLVNRLTAPLVSAATAARSGSCIAATAAQLRDVLFDAHRRATDHWATKGYGRHHNRHRDRVVRVLIETAVNGDLTPLVSYVRAFTTNAQALDELLDDLRQLFTYDDALRTSLLPVWRLVMTTALDALKSGASLPGRHHWRESALAGLLPTPQIGISDTNPAATLERVRARWLDPDDIADLAVRWLKLARGESKAVDAVADLANCSPPAWQATTGLTWAEDAINGDYAAIAGRCWVLPEWLKTVHGSGQLDVQGIARWHRLVDGLAAYGDHRAVKLQQRVE
ncbi:hypothetical protein QRX60_17765 [Amycolatopsis mongoliensis]|uniref:Uncharacterized protein n=1 Tax=Amycolatopsis mongoliensis TaxID=715475 RepID=A0A9Y2JXT4_9PSEU|nr:hypothetical protein [Amycolatopsis sp. 4-36]WIY05604.1 hypothetical protein QRX60_17765 [Amycolatopsis sp. 4-36]